MKKLYLFDFDGTLTTKDTMFLFLKFHNRRRFVVQFAKHAPLFALLKLKLLSAEGVKKSFISSVLKGETQENLQKKSEEFCEKFWPKIMRKNALDFINNTKNPNTESCLVTASLDIWAKSFAEKLGFTLISTEAEFSDEKFTGHFATPNCNGEEKVLRIKNYLGTRKFDKTIAFGDSSGDAPMLAFANEGHYKFFH